jgi:nicotinate-nucleotide--dimethylbenzimidazole phosphoribosyltransferase
MADDPILAPQSIEAFGDHARRAVYDAIELRRDVRHFREDPVEAEVLWRILGAAHRAPSVGFSQPWGFVVVRDRAVRAEIRESFLRCREAEAARFPEARREAYRSFKLEGILEAPINVAVVVDLRSRGEAILGTTIQPEAVRASACCAVQNLWLAARAEGIGVGWVSIVEPAILRRLLCLPAGVEPIAYLCVGHPRAFRDRPMLEELGWRPRRALEEVVFEGRWPEDPATGAAEGARRPATLGATPIDPRAIESARAHQRELVKPPGSLGRLEELAIEWRARRGAVDPTPRLLVFAADHGVTEEGVSAYPSSVTAAVVSTIMAGGAAISVLARRHRIPLDLVDVGIAGDLSSAPIDPVVPLLRRPIRGGTSNLARGPAMTVDEAHAAIETGREVTARAIDDGADLLGVGEVGIGNTTAAAALIVAFTGAPPASVVGQGTGIDPATRARKIAVVESALARVGSADPIEVLASLGGFELAAIAGALLGAAERGVVVVLDGFLASAAALVARAIDPGVTSWLVASHRSAEAGAAIALEALGLSPLFDLGLRLGEGTGAVLGIALLRDAIALDREMATFATAGIVRAAT